MKKILSLVLVLLIATAVFCVPAYAYAGPVEAGETLVFNGATSENAFGDLLDWSGIIFGNVNNMLDLEGPVAVGGSFISDRGLTVNDGAFSIAPAATEDVALLVNGNIDIAGYGSVYGQTVVGTAEGNTYHLENNTPSGITSGQYTVADTAGYFADAMSTAYAVKAAIEALPVNGVCDNQFGTYTFAGDPDADVLVYNVDDALINSYLFDFTIAEGQTVIVNFTSADKIDLRYGAVRINGSMEPADLRNYTRNIVINVANAAEMEMTSTEMYGILVAPDTELSGRYSNMCGVSILNALTGYSGLDLHVGTNDSFIPSIPATAPENDDEPEVPGSAEPEIDTDEDTAETVSIRIDAPLKMAVAFGDDEVYYGGEMKEVVVGREYPFQMCAVNWDNGLYDTNGNGLRGSVVYRMVAVHRGEFLSRARAAKEDPERYTVKGIDVIDNVAKTIYVNCDATDAHLETDVNSFFVAYRFHFENGEFNKGTGIENVINTPAESLSVNLPVGSTIACNAYVGEELVDSDNVFITVNSGEGVYEDEYLTSVNDYTWAK